MLRKNIISRLLFIHEQLILRNTVNPFSISKKYECSEKTIKRDINFMRDILILPIEYDRKRKSYFYSRKVYGNYWKIETVKQFLDRLENVEEN